MQKLKNNELQRKFAGSYFKKCVNTDQLTRPFSLFSTKYDKYCNFRYCLNCIVFVLLASQSAAIDKMSPRQKTHPESTRPAWLSYPLSTSYFYHPLSFPRSFSGWEPCSSSCKSRIITITFVIMHSHLKLYCIVAPVVYRLAISIIINVHEGNN